MLKQNQNQNQNEERRLPQPIKEEEFPQLNKTNINTVSLEKKKETSDKKVHLHLDWASMMKKSVEKEKEQKKPMPAENVVSLPSLKSTISKVLDSTSKSRPKNWADWSDSDDEDYDEFEVLPTGKIV